MIVRDQPSSFKLFFIMQGSVVPKILSRIIGVALLLGFKFQVQRLI